MIAQSHQKLSTTCLVLREPVRSCYQGLVQTLNFTCAKPNVALRQVRHLKQTLRSTQLYIGRPCYYIQLHQSNNTGKM